MIYWTLLFVTIKIALEILSGRRTYQRRYASMIYHWAVVEFAVDLGEFHFVVYSSENSDSHEND